MAGKAPKSPKAQRLNSAYGELIKRGLVSTQKDVADKMQASASNVSSALKGDEKVLTDRFLSRFNNAFGEIFSLAWLLTGEGSMLKSEGGAAVTLSSTGDNSHNVQGDGNHVSSAGNLEVLNKAIEEMAEQRTQMSNIIDELAAQRRLTEQVLEQNNRLLTLLERRP